MLRKHAWTMTAQMRTNPSRRTLRSREARRGGRHPSASTGTSPAASPPHVSTSTYAWKATGATKRGTAPAGRGTPPAQGRSQGNGPFRARAPPRGSPHYQDKPYPHDDSHCNSLFHASFTANHESDSLIIDDIVHSYPSLALPPFPGSPLHSNRPPFSLVTTLTVKDRAYPYTQDLLALQYTSARHAFIPQLEGMAGIVTPLVPSAWEALLQDHPDQELARYISEGLRRGFYIGYDKDRTRRSAACNMISAAKNPDPVQKYVDNEQAEGRIIGPFTPEETADIHVSRFGVIPKRHQPGKWRLILDLSSPDGMSINDGINKELSSLQYESVDDAARILMGLGKGAMLAKIDIAHAYRNVPVHPTDRYLLGMQWKGETYIDTALPFGLRSAPKIFCALSDALEWILLQAGITSCLHYIDDFLTLGAPNSLECERNLRIITDICRLLGIPLAIEKIEGPIGWIIFLGI